MAITVTAAKIGGLKSEERDGRMVMMETAHLVEGLTGSGSLPMAQSIGAAAELAGMPAYLSASVNFPNLVLVARRPRMVQDSPTKAIVTLEYREIGGVAGNGIMQGGAALQQEQTQLTVFGIPILVSHTWPADDPDFANITQTQVGEVSALRPLQTRRVSKIIETDIPELVAGQWIQKINSTQWGVVPPGEWLCTSAFGQPHDLSTSPEKHLFTFEFQWKLLGWQGYVFFIDPRTGRAPANLVQNVGKGPVILYLGRDFNSLFPDVD